MQLSAITNMEESWNQMKDTIHKAASATLGVTKPGKRYINGDIWFWNDDVEMKVCEKKCFHLKFLGDKTLANGQIYKNANREAKKTIAITRAAHYKNLYDKLDIQDGERDLYRLAKNQNERTQDIEHFCCVNDKNGTLLSNRRATTDRWQEYFEQISTEEFAHSPLSQSLSTFAAIPPFSATEVEEAIKRMKSGKATGPDDIASEPLKAKSWDPTMWLSEFPNRVIQEGDWQESTTVPI